jgi:hypothetical protein
VGPRLRVFAEADGLVGHAGAVLLRKLADQVGLTAALGSALAGREVPAGGPGCGSGFRGAGDRARGDQHERHRPAGPPRLGARCRAEQHHGATDAGAGRSAHPGQDRPGAGSEKQNQGASPTFT